MKYGSFSSQTFTVTWWDLDWYESVWVQRTEGFMFCFSPFHRWAFCKRMLYVRCYFIFHTKEGALPCGAMECGLVGGKQEVPGKLFGLCPLLFPLSCLSVTFFPLSSLRARWKICFQPLGNRRSEIILWDFWKLVYRALLFSGKLARDKAGCAGTWDTKASLQNTGFSLIHIEMFKVGCASFFSMYLLYTAVIFLILVMIFFFF